MGNKYISNVVPVFNALTVQDSEQKGEMGDGTTKLPGDPSLVALGSRPL